MKEQKRHPAVNLKTENSGLVLTSPTVKREPQNVEQGISNVEVGAQDLVPLLCFNFIIQHSLFDIRYSKNNGGRS